MDSLICSLGKANSHSLPVTVIGGGSNILVSDLGIEGLVVVNQIREYEVKEEGSSVEIRVGAGEVWDDIVERTVSAGWWGLENLSGIPGSVGGTPIQNVGAYGIEVSEAVTRVEAVCKHTLTKKTFYPDNCQFSYRNSWFKTEGW